MIEKLLTVIAARREAASERGASAVEYGLLVAGIAALIVVAVFALGPVVQEAFNDTCGSVTTADNSTIEAECAADE